MSRSRSDPDNLAYGIFFKRSQSQYSIDCTEIILDSIKEAGIDIYEKKIESSKECCRTDSTK